VGETLVKDIIKMHPRLDPDAFKHYCDPPLKTAYFVLR